MLRLQRNKADVLQLCPVEAEGINNIYSQKKENVTMSATIKTKYRERGRRGMRRMEGGRKTGEIKLKNKRD